MFKEQMNKIKGMLAKNTEEKPEEKKDKRDKKKIENLVVFLVILIITLIAVNAILNDDDDNEENLDSAYKELAVDDELSDKTSNSDDLEERLERILETISGVRQGKCLNYLFTVV